MNNNARILVFVIVMHELDHTCCVSNREIRERFRASYNGKEDIHTKLMRTYKSIPNWWFHVMLVVSLILSLALCIFMKDEIQMPWWGLIFAAGLALIFTLPVSIITATTNQVCLPLETHLEPAKIEINY